MAVRIKRILAFIIDWNISLLPAFLALVFIIPLARQHPAAALLLFPMMLAALAVFVLRDLIFKGRSLGKRALGLYVYDRKTLTTASPRQRAVRNLFFFLYFFDGIILLASGQSIGDRAAGTIVLYQKEPVAAPPAPVPSRKQGAKIAAIIAAAVIIWIGATLGIVFTALNSQKDSEEYRLAYAYLVSSSAFGELDADESDVMMNRYSARTTYNPDGSPSKTAQIGFLVNGQPFEVICHQEDGVWTVCEECTLFE